MKKGRPYTITLKGNLDDLAKDCLRIDILVSGLEQGDNPLVAGILGVMGDRMMARIKAKAPDKAIVQSRD